MDFPHIHRQRQHLLLAAVHILKTHNIVFTQIRAALNFNNLQRHLPWIGQAVGLSKRDIGALVFCQQHHLISIGNFSGAAHHHPMLRSVVVHLQGQGGAGFDLNAFDLVSLTRINSLVPPPGPVHTAVLQSLGRV